jgi:Zn-dependent membrane protease YugP
MSVSLAQGGDGLGAMWGREKARELLTKAGFNDINIHRLEHDIQNDYYVMTK